MRLHWVTQLVLYAVLVRIAADVVVSAAVFHAYAMAQSYEPVWGHAHRWPSPWVAALTTFGARFAQAMLYVGTAAVVEILSRWSQRLRIQNASLSVRREPQREPLWSDAAFAVAPGDVDRHLGRDRPYRRRPGEHLDRGLTVAERVDQHHAGRVGRAISACAVVFGPVLRIRGDGRIPVPDLGRTQTTARRGRPAV